MWGSLRGLPRTPRSFLLQVRQCQAMGQVPQRSQEERAGEAGRCRWPPSLFRLASAKRMLLNKSSRLTQVLRVRKRRSRSSRLPSSGENLRHSPHTIREPGLRSYHPLACRTGTPLWFGASLRALTSESRRSTAPSRLQTTTQFDLCSMCIASLSIMSLPPGITLARSPVISWRPALALSSHPCCPLFPRLQSRASSAQSTTSHIPIPPLPMPHPSTPASTVMCSRAPGGHSPHSPCSSRVSPRVPKPPCEMLRRLTGLSLSPLPNGLAWSSASKQKTSLPSMHAITSGSHQLGEYMEWWPMLVLTYFEAVASAPWPNGWMTTYFSESHAHTSQSTTHSESFGNRTYRPVGGAGRAAAGFGMEANTCLTGPRKSLMKIAAQRSRTWWMLRPDPWKTCTSPMPAQTSTRSPRAWESGGNHPSQCPSELRYRTSASCGTCVHEQSTCWMRKGRNTWRPSQNGKKRTRTTSLTPSGCTESYCTLRWSFQQGKPTSPTWRPCWPLSITVLSFCTPLHETPNLTSSGGDYSSTAQPFQGPSQSRASRLTTVPTLMLAWESELQSRSALGGVRGGSPQDGNPRVETSNGQKLSALNYLSLAYARLHLKESMSSYMGTTVGLSKAGGKG
jgi:hypothetical protein